MAIDTSKILNVSLGDWMNHIPSSKDSPVFNLVGVSHIGRKFLDDPRAELAKIVPSNAIAVVNYNLAYGNPTNNRTDEEIIVYEVSGVALVPRRNN